MSLQVSVGTDVSDGGRYETFSSEISHNYIVVMDELGIKDTLYGISHSIPAQDIVHLLEPALRKLINDPKRYAELILSSSSFDDFETFVSFIGSLLNACNEDPYFGVVIKIL